MGSLPATVNGDPTYGYALNRTSTSQTYQQQACGIPIASSGPRLILCLLRYRKQFTNSYMSESGKQLVALSSAPAERIEQEQWSSL